MGEPEDLFRKLSELLGQNRLDAVETMFQLFETAIDLVELPVHHYPRTHGTSQFFRVSNVLRTLRDLVGLWVALVLLRRGKRESRSVPSRDDGD